jgi:hypothetical protein
VIDPDQPQDEFVGPVSSYEVIETKIADNRFIAAEVDATPAETAAPDQSQESRPKTAVRNIAPAVMRAKSSSRATKWNKLVLLAGVGAGVMAGLAAAMFFYHPSPADTSTDLGPVISNETGLKGDLVTNWGDRLNYKLTIEPSDPGLQGDFTSTVYNPQQPLTVNVQLKSATGTVLCEHPVLLKYDPLRTGTPLEPIPAPKGKKIDEISVDQEQVSEALNNAKLLSQELDREHGKDIFTNKFGPNGQVASINAQGTLPCTKQQYQSTVAWAFTSNFPVLAQPTGASGLDDDLAAVAQPASKDSDAFKTVAAKRHTIAPPANRFSVEQDDTAVSYQASTGVIETRGGKAFQMEKRDVVVSALQGTDFPRHIHYRCDQFGACALAGIGTGIQRAWLEH